MQSPNRFGQSLYPYEGDITKTVPLKFVILISSFHFFECKQY